PIGDHDVPRGAGDLDVARDVEARRGFHGPVHGHVAVGPDDDVAGEERAGAVHASLDEYGFGVPVDGDGPALQPRIDVYPSLCVEGDGAQEDRADALAHVDPAAGLDGNASGAYHDGRVDGDIGA